jgi:hypothetical protein
MEKLILRIKLKRKVTNDVMSRVRQMEVLKRLLAFFLEKKPEEFDVATIDWENFSNKITHKKDEIIR